MVLKSDMLLCVLAELCYMHVRVRVRDHPSVHATVFLFAMASGSPQVLSRRQMCQVMCCMFMFMCGLTIVRDVIVPSTYACVCGSIVHETFDIVL